MMMAMMMLMKMLILHFGCLLLAVWHVHGMLPKERLQERLEMEGQKRARTMCQDHRHNLRDGRGRYQPVYTFSTWLGAECRPKDFEFGHVLGSGSTCTVRKARHVPSGIHVAIKIGRIKQGTDSSCLRWRNEECIQHPVDHPFVAKHLCSMVSEDGGEMYLVEELVEGNNLHDTAWGVGGAIKLRTVDEVRLVSAMVFLAFEHLHRLGVILRDTKPGNVMLSKDKVVKVIDFGSSKFYHMHKGLVEDEYGECDEIGEEAAVLNDDNRLNHHLPIVGFFTEIRRHAQHQPYVDFYGFAVILFELLSGRDYKKAWSERPKHHGDRQMDGFVCSSYMDRDGCEMVEMMANLRWTKKTDPFKVHRYAREHPWFAPLNLDNLARKYMDEGHLHRH